MVEPTGRPDAAKKPRGTISLQGKTLKRSLFVIVKMFDPQSVGTLLGEADCK